MQSDSILILKIIAAHFNIVYKVIIWQKLDYLEGLLL